jgi:hypothetical protein
VSISRPLVKFIEGKWLDWMDTEMKPQDQDGEGKLPTSMLFGPRIIREKFFQLCSPEVRTRASLNMLDMLRCYIFNIDGRVKECLINYRIETYSVDI